jgi:hypothetical protein
LICCNECLITAKCEEEFNYHIWTEHDDPKESKFEQDFFYKICRISCKTVGDIKAHITKHHTKKVQVCSYFLKGKCTFTDEDCWFDYDYDKLDTESVQDTQIDCRFCVETFKSMRYVMKHTKSEHPSTVSECKNYKTGCCRFQDDKCWFKHNEVQFFDKKHPKIIEKLFTFMEKMKHTCKMMKALTTSIE